MRIAAARWYSRAAIELSALAEDEVDGLFNYASGDISLKSFDYLSVHGPAKGRKLPEQELVAKLRRFCPLADSIVMHPDTMYDFELYKVLGSSLVVENLDDRKTFGQSVDDLEHVFRQLPAAGFCLDLAHAKSVDPTMDLAHELAHTFKTRLRQVHLSSIGPDQHHCPLTESDWVLFQPVLKHCQDVPWIFEELPSDSILSSIDPSR